MHIQFSFHNDLTSWNRSENLKVGRFPIDDKPCTSVTCDIFECIVRELHPSTVKCVFSQENGFEKRARPTALTHPHRIADIFIWWSASRVSLRECIKHIIKPNSSGYRRYSTAGTHQLCPSSQKSAEAHQYSGSKCQFFWSLYNHLFSVLGLCTKTKRTVVSCEL